MIICERWETICERWGDIEIKIVLAVATFKRNGAMGGERLQGEADDLREGQPATAQREQLPENVWRAMSQREKARFRFNQNRKLHE